MSSGGQQLHGVLQDSVKTITSSAMDMAAAMKATAISQRPNIETTCKARSTYDGKAVAGQHLEYIRLLAEPDV